MFREIPAGMNLGQGIKAIQALAAKKDPVPNIIINPTLFKTYNIIAVPTIVILEDELLPGCSSVLNGVRFPFDRTNQGHHGMGDMDGDDGSFMYYHYYAFPLMVMLDLFIKQASNPDGYMDLDIITCRSSTLPGTTTNWPFSPIPKRQRWQTQLLRLPVLLMLFLRPQESLSIK